MARDGVPADEKFRRMHQLLPDIGVAVLAATLLGLVAHWTRQPIILGYLVAGAAIGPRLGFALVHDQQSIEVISELGKLLLTLNRQ